MKKLFFMLLFMHALAAKTQLVMNLQLPPSGVVVKTQLWNMMVINTGKLNIEASVSFLMSNASGQPILSAKTGSYNFPPGNTFINASTLAPIQYTILSGDWVIDGNPAGFLPPGSFQICYTLIPAFAHTPPVTDCNMITIEPLSPPQLILPENRSAVDTTGIPQFVWIPPAPLNLFTNLQYQLYLVQIDSFQTPAEAVHLNIPILFLQNISTNNLLYPLSAPQLQPNVKYAWQVTAMNNQVPVSASETWVFTLKAKPAVKRDTSDLPYVRLKKDDEAGYAICARNLKFAYRNETADSTWNLQFFDISSAHPVQILFSLDTMLMTTGLNLMKIDLSRSGQFVDKDLYLMELHNSRNEVWRMKFEYLKDEY